MIFVRINFKRNDYSLFVEKASDKVTFCKLEDSGVSGLKDDISGLTIVTPICFTPNNEMVWVIQPVKLLKWLNANPGKAAIARAKLPWLKDIDEFSNPVIAIGRCR